MAAKPYRKWIFSDIQKLKEVAETHTTEELMKLFPTRTRKSIERQIEKLRAVGKIGYRDIDTKKRAYQKDIE